jgi:hypothetical protein
MGDPNLDWKKNGIQNYAFNHYFDDMDEAFDHLNLV